MPYSERTNHRIWYETKGDGDPVLLIMGFTMRGRAWRFQIDEFAKHHQVAWYDHAGVGESGPLVAKPLRMHHMALDALGVMDSLGWEKAHIVGISMGGMISQHLALYAPHRVSSLTLAATHPGGVSRAIPPVVGIKLFAQTQRGSTDQRLDALSKLLFGQEFREADPKRIREMLLTDHAGPPPQATSLAQLGAVARHNTYARLGELSQHPTLIMRPGADVLIKPQGSDILGSRIEGSTVVPFPKSGHAVSRECADLFNEVALEHFQSSAQS